MQARRGNPAVIVPGALAELVALAEAARKTGVPQQHLHPAGRRIGWLSRS